MIWLRKNLYTILLTVKAALLALAYAKGRSDANSSRDAKEHKDYRHGRKSIDSEVSSIGSTDAERIERLQSISNRRGTGQN